ncbi:hypothetical protein KSS87_007878, partial [Heliosperma pusillum]
ARLLLSLSTTWTIFISLLIITPTQSHTPTSSKPTIQLPTRTTTTISVLDHGATGNGHNYDTLSIQSAINSCPSPTPCHVIFPAGSYLTATLHLRSGVVLVIQKSAVILAGTKVEDYPVESERWYAVLGEQVDNVGITGGGEINGQGLEFVERFDERKNVMVSWNRTGSCFGDECRPRLVGFIGCTNVSVNNVRLIQPAYWCLHIVGCDNTAIHDLTIYGDFNSPNNDGIDITDSNNTVITRCHIDTGDDAICPKTSNGPLYNLTATDCWIRTKSSAIKLGSASSFDFVHLLFDNITIHESHRGLGLQIRDGGNVNDITFSNINISTRYYDPSWWGRAEPIYITSCPRSSTTKEGSISGLRFINITSISENGAFVSGSKGGLIHDLTFRNVSLSFKRWTNYAGGLVDYRPGCSGLVKHSMAGIIMEHVDGFNAQRLNMRWSEDGSIGWDNPLYFTPGTVNNISFLDFHSGLYYDQQIISC